MVNPAGRSNSDTHYSIHSAERQVGVFESRMPDYQRDLHTKRVH